MKVKASSLTVLLGILATLTHCGSSGDDSATNGGSGGASAGSAGAASAGKGGSTAATAGTTGQNGGSAGRASTAGTGNEAGESAGGTTAGTGGSSGSTSTAGSTAMGEAGEAGAAPVSDNVIIRGVVPSVAFTAGSATEPTMSVGYYQGATVCVDSNNNGKCEAGEPSGITAANGAFSITAPALSGIIADIPTTATNTANNKANPGRNVFRASLDQVKEASQNVVVSAMSSEVQRLVEANGSSYALEKSNLAERISAGVVTVRTEDVLADPAALTAGTRYAVEREAQILTGRFQYAITKLDRGDKYPDDLATPDNVADTRTAITFAQSQQAAFNIEAIPRYDHIFIIMLENKSTQTLLGSKYAPKINAYLAAGNQAGSYYATGNPSEPNYTALGGADDFGITDDSQWNCDATGANAVQDLPVPDKTQPGLASSPFAATCTQVTAQNANPANHNITGKPNLFNAINGAGMTWRTYSESMNPGQDFRTDSVADANVKAQDHVYAPGTLNLNTTVVGDANLILPMPGGLYKTKHHPGMAYQNVRSEADFKYSNRTLGGGQWDNSFENATAYAIPAGYDSDQFGTDLETGNIGNLNFVVPDQCDDMHGITVSGTEIGSATTGTASDCSSLSGGNNTPVAAAGSNIITRGDNYVDYLVKKIQTSNIWKNPQKRVAIVMMFDEGSATAPEKNSCCGWKAGKTATNSPLDTTGAPIQGVASYPAGNQGHGVSIFGVLTNQAGAPKQINDTDTYSHFSFVRTLQDMFGLADPAVDSSYMNRSRYTEKFIAANIANLPEFAGSGDTHFDAVRPMNHVHVIPAAYTPPTTVDLSLLRPVQTGADPNQTNIWALKK